MTDATCSHCDYPAKLRGYCYAHYRRWKLGQDMEKPVQGRTKYAEKCSHCDRKAKMCGYCTAHYRRFRRGLDMDTPIRARKATPGVCGYDDCGRPSYGHSGLCQQHANQQRQGLPLKKIRIRTIFDEVKLGGAHQRVRRLWGDAAQYSCIECGNRARDWAYDGTDPNELLGRQQSGKGSLQRYSCFPEFYMPMCRKCHNSRDNESRIRELDEYRQWKLRHGITLADLDNPEQWIAQQQEAEKEAS